MPNGAQVAARFSVDQVDDLLELLQRRVPLGVVVSIATAVLGHDARREAANAVTEKARMRAIVEAVNARGLLPDALIRFSGDTHPNGALALAIHRLLQGRTLRDDATYQKLVNEYEPFIGSEIFNVFHGQIKHQICAIALGEPRNTIAGSGFLIAPQLVMTNYHILEPFLSLGDDHSITENADGKEIYCFFDYLRPPTPPVPPGTPQPSIVTARPGRNWLKWARLSLANDGTEKCCAILDRNEYDYAVIELERPIGSLPVDAGGGPLRGWVRLHDQINPVEKQKIVVFQHPQKAYQQMDIGDFEQLDATQTRVWYSVSTAHGSSGGAAVDATGKLFALHNAEVDRPDVAKQLNQGIRIDIITKDLLAKAPECVRANTGHGSAIPFWSLSDDPADPQPIIGREPFVQHVTEMAKPDAARVLVVTGPPGTGVHFSVRLLRRVVGVRTPVVEFKPNELQVLSPEAFVAAIANEVGRSAPESAKIPAPQSTEDAARWLRIDLPRWLAAEATAAERNGKAASPAWVVIDTIVPQGAQLLWAQHLRDCVAALTGVYEPGEPATDIPQLRWLFLGSALDGLPIGGTNRRTEDLSRETDFAADVYRCLDAAARTMGTPVPMSAAQVSAIVQMMLQQSSLDPARKTLSDLVRNLILAAKTKNGGNG